MLTHKQSFLLFQELYHRQFINMKDTESATVVEIAAKNPLLKEKFDYIFFTGNHNVGRVVMEGAAKHLTPVTLELGGKNPVIVTKHADLYLAAKRILCLRCFNGGQQCVSPDYVLVEKEVEEAFYEQIRRVEKEW